MLHIEPRPDHAAAIVGARSLGLGHASQPPTRAVLAGCWRHTLIVAICTSTQPVSRRRQEGIAMNDMHAVRIHHRAGPAQLVFELAPRPIPHADDVLVDVHAPASLRPAVRLVLRSVPAV